MAFWAHWRADNFWHPVLARSISLGCQPPTANQQPALAWVDSRPTEFERPPLSNPNLPSVGERESLILSFRNRDCPVLQRVLLARLSRYWINSVVEFFSIVQIQYYVWQPKLARLSRYWIGARPMWKQQVIPWYQCPSQYRPTISVPNIYLTIFSWEMLRYHFIHVYFIW